MHHVYIGWNNPRKVWAMHDPFVAVLLDGDKATVLQGSDAEGFLKDIREVSHHICGIHVSSWVTQTLKVVGEDRDRLKIYNFVFDKWKGSN